MIKIARKLVEGSHAAREMVTVFSMNFFLVRAIQKYVRSEGGGVHKKAYENVQGGVTLCSTKQFISLC